MKKLCILFCSALAALPMCGMSGQESVLEDGYYWFVSAAGGTDANFAIYAENANNSATDKLRWKALDNLKDKAFIWHVTQVEGGGDSIQHYSVKNLLTNEYINKSEGGVSKPIMCSKDSVTSTLFLNNVYGFSNAWLISDTADYYTGQTGFNMKGHGSGSGDIVTYYPEKFSAWYVLKVSDSIISGGEPTVNDSLQMLYAKIPYDWETQYVLGSDPGYVEDTTKYDSFRKLYAEAANAASLDEEKAMEIYNELSQQWQWLQGDENLVPVEENGYYWFFTANNSFVNGAAGGNFAIYAEDSGDPAKLRWKAFDETDPAFIWRINKKTSEVGSVQYYAVQNAGTNAYIDESIKHIQSDTVYMSAEFKSPCFFSSITHNGQWFINDSVDNDKLPGKTFHQGGHSSGKGRTGNIMLYAGSAGDGSAWYIKKVPDYVVHVVVPGQTATYKDSLQMLYASIPQDWESKYVLGSDPGYVTEDSTKAYERMEDLRGEAANAASLNEEQCKKIFGELNRLWKWLKSGESIVPVEDGNYWFISAADPSTINHGDTGGKEFAIYVSVDEDGPDTLRWKVFNDTDPTFVWQVTKTGNSVQHYIVQNFSTKEYIDKVPEGDSVVMCSKTLPVTPTLFLPSYDSHVGMWLISDTVDYEVTGSGSMGFHMEDHLSGVSGNIIIYFNENTGDNTSWYLKKVPADAPVMSVGGVESGDAGQAAVDVYTADGVLVRRGVPRAAATDGLAKGVYVIGKRKVLVK